MVAPRARRRPGPPDARRPGRAADGGVAGGRRPRARADPAPRQLRGDADPSGPALRPRPAGDRRVRAGPARTAGPGEPAAPGDDAVRARGAGQARAGRRRRLLRARLDRRDRHHARARPDRVRRRRAAAAELRRPDAGAARRPAAGRSSGGCAWTRWWSTVARPRGTEGERGGRGRSGGAVRAGRRGGADRAGLGGRAGHDPLRGRHRRARQARAPHGGRRRTAGLVSDGRGA